MYHNPELGFEEYETSKYLVNFIENHSQKVNYPSHDLETAFDVTYGDSGPLTVICVEYDAFTVADRVMLFDEGQLVEENTPDEFFNNPKSDRTKLFLSQIL